MLPEVSSAQAVIFPAISGGGGRIPPSSESQIPPGKHPKYRKY